MITDPRPRVPVAARARVASLVLLVAAAFAVGSCDKVPLTAPSNATIKLYADTPIVPLGGSAKITATVIQTGGSTVHNGTVVSFTTSLGTMEPLEATTQDGKCTVTFRAGSQSGTAVINAYSGGASTTSTGTTTGGGTGGTTGGTTTGSGSGVTLLVGAAAAASVVVTASPGTVPGVGGLSTITATVLDANNNSLPAVPVSFATDIGSVSPPNATTDQTGQASTTLSTYQTATVTVTAGPKITGTVKVTATPVPTVTIGVPATAPTVGIPAAFTVTVAAGSGGAPITNVTMTIVKNNTGATLATMNLGQPNGAVTVNYTFAQEGTYTVTVNARDASGQTATASVPVTVLAAQPFTLTMSATTGRVNNPVTITATAPPGSPSIVTYRWNVGGAIVGHPDGLVETSIPTVTVTYTALPCSASVCTVQLNVTAIGADGRIGFGSTSTTITP
jgi:hypothetical protein